MKTKKILVVEDERLVAEDIAECLRSRGFEVCGIAKEGQDAIAKAREHRPDLALMDIVIQGDSSMPPGEEKLEFVKGGATSDK